MANETDLTKHALALAASEWGGKVDGSRLMPIGSALSGLVAEEGLSCTIAGSWFVAQADARQEKRAIESVSQLGFPAYRPVVVKDQIVRGRKVTIERSMFGMYFFARCEPTPDNWQRIRTARGVRSLLADNSGQSRPVPDKAMEVIRLVEARHASPALKSRFIYHFAPGDVTRVTNGPFASFYAKLETAVDEHGRLTALVDIFGRDTRVQFDADQLEAL